MPEMPTLITPLLDQVHTPADLRQLQPNQLRQLADELRQEVISAVGVTGGHLGPGLGVVELTTAIHYVFNTRSDQHTSELQYLLRTAYAVFCFTTTNHHNNV